MHHTAFFVLLTVICTRSTYFHWQLIIIEPDYHGSTWTDSFVCPCSSVISWLCVHSHKVIITEPDYPGSTRNRSQLKFAIFKLAFLCLFLLTMLVWINVLADNFGSSALLYHVNWHKSYQIVSTKPVCLLEYLHWISYFILTIISPVYKMIAWNPA